MLSLPRRGHHPEPLVHAMLDYPGMRATSCPSLLWARSSSGLRRRDDSFLAQTPDRQSPPKAPAVFLLAHSAAAWLRVNRFEASSPSTARRSPERTIWFPWRWRPPLMEELVCRQKRLPAVALMVLMLWPAAAWAPSAAGIAGVARDTTGAALPGVTVEVASPALIEKVRTAVTDARAIQDHRAAPWHVHRHVHARRVQRRQARRHRAERRDSPRR